MTAVYLCLCRYEISAALLHTCTISPYSSLVATIEENSLQVDKAPLERNSSTRSDKLITDYLSRHSASAASKSVEDHIGRQPLAALQNLQAALSNLHVAYDLNKPAKNAGSKLMATAHIGPAGSNVPQYGAGARSNQTQVIRSNAMQAQSIRPQSHTIHCTPTPETACCSDASKVQPACCLLQHDPAGFTAAQLANSPSTPLQTDYHSSISDKTKHTVPTLTCIGTSAEQDMSTSDHCQPGAEPAAANTPATVQYTPDYTPAVYCTPDDSSPTHAHFATFESPPSNGKECWYTPGTTHDTCDSDDVATDLTECASSPSNFLSRPDSPSLLYGQGSAFSADTLGQGNDVSSQWLTN